MEIKTNYFKIGMFVIAAAIITVVGVVVMGAGTFFKRKMMIETYFQESVQGLEVGSPFKFRGVRFGKVEDITLLGKEYSTHDRHILVRVSIPQEIFSLKIGNMSLAEFKKEVDKGLRVRLAFQGITGTAFLEMDYLEPDLNPALTVDWTPKYLYIPSSPSRMSRISTTLDKVTKSLDELKVHDLIGDLEIAARSLKEALQKADFGAVGTEAKALLGEVRSTNRVLKQILGSTEIKDILSKTSASAGAIHKGAEAFPAVVEQMQKMLRKMDGLISKKQQDIEVSIENFRVFSDNLRELSENAKRNPSQFFLGKPPPPVKLQKK